jgi:hypothetical protein
VAVVLAALRDVANDAEQETDEDGTTDKTNVTTKSGSAAEAAGGRGDRYHTVACSWEKKEAAALRDC